MAKIRMIPRKLPILNSGFSSAAAVLCTLAKLLLSVAVPLAAQQSSSMLGGWLQTKLTPQDLQIMLQGKDPKLVQLMVNNIQAIRKNPNDEPAWSSFGAICLMFSRVKTPVNRWDYWQMLSAKALERAIQLNPKDWYAWHNYGQLNFEAGDLWMVGSHDNARRAVWSFTQAIALNPRSARSYMGRGFAYMEMNDGAHANADFAAALRLDPSLRSDIEKEVAGIRQQKAEEAGARAELHSIENAKPLLMPGVNDPLACQKAKGVWLPNGRGCMSALVFGQ